MGSSGQLPNQFGDFTFPGNMAGGVIPRVYLAEDNQDGGKLLHFPRSPNTPYVSGTPRKHTNTKTRHPQGRKSDSVESLLDLLLPLDLSELFIGLLEPVGYRLYEDSIPNATSDPQVYNYVENKNAPKDQKNARCLIHIGERFLRKPSYLNLTLIESIFTNFAKYKPGSYIIVCSRLKQVDAEFRNVIHGNKQPKGINGNIIFKDDIKRLEAKDSTDERKRNLLKDMLGIDKL